MKPKPFFKLVRKGETVKGVHSESDMKYLLVNGWKPLEYTKLDTPKEYVHVKYSRLEIPTFVKRK